MTQAKPHSAPDCDDIFLVDGSGYIFRAYYAVGQGLTNPEGVPVGAVLGFTNMVLKLLTDMHAPFDPRTLRSPRHPADTKTDQQPECF